MSAYADQHVHQAGSNTLFQLVRCAAAGNGFVNRGLALFAHGVSFFRWLNFRPVLTNHYHHAEQKTKVMLCDASFI